MSFTSVQAAGITELLRQNWERESDQERPPRPTIQVPEIQREPWGEGLSYEEARRLMQLGLEFGGWYVFHTPITNRLGIVGYQYTDEENSSRVNGYYPFRAP